MKQMRYLSILGMGLMMLLASCENLLVKTALPNSPTGTTAAAGDAQASISWTTASGATAYNLYWSTTSGVTTATGTKIAGVTSPYTHMGLTNGTTYYYVVTATNVTGESSASNQASTTPQVAAPGAPTGLGALGGNAQATVTWSPVSGATSYNLYWSTTSGVTTSTGTKITGVTSPYTYTGLTNGTTYYAVVTAVNAGGESTASAQVSATPQVTTPGAPTGLSALGGNAQATVTWSSVSGATSYNLYWSTTSGVTTSTGTKITGVTSPYVHTGLTNGTTYYAVVTAVNAGGESTASAQVSATPQITTPGAPTGLSALGGNAQATVTWSPVSGATSYNLYWSTTSRVTTSTGTKITGVTSPYVHTGLSNGSPYYYVVTAANAGGESLASTAVSATPAAVFTYAFSAANWYSVYTDADGSFSSSFTNQNHITFAADQMSIVGAFKYRNLTSMASRKMLPASTAWTIRTTYQPNNGGQYGYSQCRVFTTSTPSSPWDGNNGIFGHVFTTHHSYAGSITIPDATTIYVLITNSGSGTMTQTVATGNYSDAGGSLIDTETATVVTSRSVGLSYLFSDAYASNPGIVVTGISLF